MRRLLLAGALALTTLPCLGTASASAATTWLCRPGQADDACAVGLKTTRFTPSGQRLDTRSPNADRPRRIDCFYVYPTVSDEPGIQASLAKRPELRSIARFQAARYGSRCRIFAPVYRQLTLKGIGAGVPRAQQAQAALSAYADVRAAFREYLRRYNHGRGFVVIGHSQGAAMGTRLVRGEIDARPAVRRRLVSAILLGGNVAVRRGRDAGGDFRHVPACRRPGQTGCVVAFSTYGETPPADSIFGRIDGRLNRLSGTPARTGLEVLCTNPAALRGGLARLHPAFPSAPFAPGTTIAAGIGLLGYTLPTAATPWVAVPGSFTGRCESANGANVLRLRPRAGAPTLKPSPDATWGLHLVDANIALDDLVKLVGRQERAYERAQGSRPRFAG